VRALIAVVTGLMALALLVLEPVAARMPLASFRPDIKVGVFTLAVGRSADAKKRR
jgi:hypothetical protein